MKITIENYTLISQEYGGFNLIEHKKSTNKEGKGYLRDETISYGISLTKAVKTIIRRNLHDNPNVLSLRQYIVEYSNEVNRIEKLLDLENIKNK